MKDYNVMQRIPGRKKMEFMRKAEQMEGKQDIFELAKKTALFYGKKEGWNLEQTKTACLSLYACGLCVWRMNRAETIYDYIIGYINWKQRIFQKMNDLGAFGDSIETIVHLVACRKIWRTSRKNLHVSEISKTDVRINGIRYEVGHNGKTWNDSIPDDAMHGPFDGVIYGVFDAEETEIIINFFRAGKTLKGIKAVCDLLYVFPDKYAHQAFMDSLGRSATIQYKGHLDKYQTIYNDSKRNAFIKAVENSGYLTLTKYMQALGNNEYLPEE